MVATSDSDQDVFINCRERFLQEARLLASLGRNGGTPGVVRVITFFEANETAYSVMELLTGETLDEVLRTAPDHALPADKLEVVLRGILEPLRTVHAAGFLHRDIKPSNVLIGADGQPVLIDFGSARFWGPSSNTTQTQIYSGHYAPVEQMMQGTAQGPYSDIYAVGGVAYRAIGGSLVDARIRQQAVLSRQPDPLVPAVEVGRGRYPHDVLQAIDRALAVSAENRPQRAEDLLNLLDDDRTIDRKTLFAADGPSWSHDSGPPRRIPERDEHRRPRLLAQGLLAARRPRPMATRQGEPRASDRRDRGCPGDRRRLVFRNLRAHPATGGAREAARGRGQEWQSGGGQIPALDGRRHVGRRASVSGQAERDHARSE